MTYRGYVKNGQITLNSAERLPEGAQVNVEVLDSQNGNGRIIERQRILKMSLEHRRNLLSKQAERLAEHYESDKDRSAWQGGDIIE
jgi:hypothetical protein